MDTKLDPSRLFEAPFIDEYAFALATVTVFVGAKRARGVCGSRKEWEARAAKKKQRREAARKGWITRRTVLLTGVYGNKPFPRPTPGPLATAGGLVHARGKAAGGRDCGPTVRGKKPARGSGRLARNGKGTVGQNG